MKAASVKELKQELNHRSPQELLDLCLRLSKFKKENKELLTYLLFEAQDEQGYIQSIQRVMDEQFEQINKKSYYFIKKSVRKILSQVKKNIRYSSKKETEVELLMYFCHKLKEMKPSIERNNVLKNLYIRQIELIKKGVSQLHEDLQADYESELKAF